MKRISYRLFIIFAAFAAISRTTATPLDDFLAHRDRLALSFRFLRPYLGHVPPAVRNMALTQWTTREAPEIVALLKSAAQIVAVTPSPNLGGVGSEGGRTLADDPAWWRNWGVVDSIPSNPYAVINQVQLRLFIAKAVEELNADLAPFGGAGPKLNALVASWPKDNAAEAVNIGQLKSIGNLFYSRLVQIVYTDSIPFWLAPNPRIDQLPATIGQLKAVFSFDVTLDSDADGLPDWWERRYFGHLGVDPNADPDGDGQTNSQEFVEGTDPTKPPPPVLTITRGDGQAGGAGGYVPQVLTVQLSRGWQSMANAPITFTVTQGSGQVQATRTSAPASTLTVAANSSGIARVYFKLPNTSNTVCKVAATGSFSDAQVSVLFTETAGDSTYIVQKEACIVSNVRGTLNPDGSQNLTWENNTDEPTPIWKREDNGSWTYILTIPAGQTSCHLAPGQ